MIVDRLVMGPSSETLHTAGPPMTIGNMHANGVGKLDVPCWVRYRRAMLSADPWPDEIGRPAGTMAVQMIVEER
jgi:hypothetical protein